MHFGDGRIWALWIFAFTRDFKALVFIVKVLKSQRLDILGANFYPIEIFLHRPGACVKSDRLVSYRSKPSSDLCYRRPAKLMVFDRIPRRILRAPLAVESIREYYSLP